MKAVAVFPTEKAVRLIDHEEPRITAPNLVKLRMLEVGICGTDREITSFQYGFPPDGFDYLVMGHESLGEVMETGPDVKSLKPGDLVVPTVRRPCARAWCLPCASGRQDFCASGDYTERGIKQRHGFLTEFVVEEERYLNAVPRQLREHAVLTEPLTIAEKSLLQLWKLQERLPWRCAHSDSEGPGHCHNAVVLGAGPVGLLGAMALKVAGFDVTVYSRTHSHEDKDAILGAMGVNFVAAETHTVEQMAQQVGSIDVVYEAVGASGLAFDVLKQLGTNAVFIFTGVPGLKAPIPVDADRIMRDMVLKNQIAVGSVNAPPESFAAAIRDLEEFQRRWPDALSKLITARYPIDDALRPMTTDVGGIKNIITIAS
jgi:threonine dehydrogenase-like Zn-dependent dehydrogenase